MGSVLAETGSGALSMGRTVLLTRRRFLGIAAGLLVGGASASPGAVARAWAMPVSRRPVTAFSGVAGHATRGQRTPGEVAREAEESSLLELLRLVPDEPDNRLGLTMTDVALAASRAGLQPPADDATDEAVVAYAEALFGAGIAGGPFISGLDSYAPQAPARRRYLAFGVGNVDQTALAGSPPRQYEVVRGRFDPSATDAALSACADCVPPTRAMHEGVPFYSWGDDFQQDLTRILSAPAYDEFGRGGRLAVQSQHVYRTLWTEGMRTSIETGLGRRPSLADIPALGAMVAGLGRLDTYSVYVTGDTSSQSAQGLVLESTALGVPTERIQGATDPATLLRPYGTIALGVGKDDGGLYMTLALLHATEQRASENVDILPRRIEQASSLKTGQPWSELFGDAEATAEQNIVFARVRMRGGRPNLWLSWWYNRDSLLLYG